MRCLWQSRSLKGGIATKTYRWPVLPDEPVSEAFPADRVIERMEQSLFAPLKSRMVLTSVGCYTILNVRSHVNRSIDRDKRIFSINKGKWGGSYLRRSYGC